MKWLRPGLPPFHTALAMIGAKAGDRVVFLGAADGRLAAEVALVTGLNGRTLVVDRTDGAAARVERAASQAGALVEFESAALTELPLEAGDVDVVAVNGQMGALAEVAARAMALESLRVLRPGGRFVALEAGKPAGWRGLLQRSPQTPVDPDRLIASLTAAGFRAVRVLGESEGTMYLEGVRGRA